MNELTNGDTLPTSQEIKRLEFLNSEEHKTIDELTGYVVRLAYALEQADKYLPDRLQHAVLIAEARKAVNG